MLNPTASRVSDSPARVSNSHFDRDDCLNCGVPLTGAYCAACGQKKAARIGGSTVRKEAWSRFRWFELDAIKSVWKLIRSPGGFARDYVLGKRSAQMHPLGLLLLMIGALVVLLGETQYLVPTLASEEAQRMFALVREYSKWSFSLGIIAIYASAMLVFRKRLGYNATEILALAVYIHAVCIALQIVNQLPLLAWRRIVGAAQAHLGEAGGFAVHPLHHVVTADAGHRPAAFGHARRGVVRAARAEVRHAIERRPRFRERGFLGLQEGQPLLDAPGGVEAPDAPRDHARDLRRRQLAGRGQDPFALLVELADHPRTHVVAPVVQLLRIALNGRVKSLGHPLDSLRYNERTMRPMASWLLAALAGVPIS